jgi:hypothetical protein
MSEVGSRTGVGNPRSTCSVRGGLKHVDHHAHRGKPTDPAAGMLGRPSEGYKSQNDAQSELCVRLNKHIDVLLDKDFWSGLSPNSIVLDGFGAIYIGMQHGVAKITQTPGKPTVT